ncbi:MAG: TetR/AcrR family transcriptional regulator [Planctomycetota bacterium]
MAPAGRPKSFDTTEALEAAMAVFWEHGFDGASIGSLVAAMGIGRQSLYDTFTDKRGLYLAALEHYGQRAVAKTLALLDAPGEPADRIRAVFEQWLALQTQPDCQGCFMANTLAELDRSDDAVAGVVDKLQASLADAFARTVAEAQRRGQLRDDLAAEDIAAMLTAIGHGLALAGRSPSNRTLVPAGVRATIGFLGLTAPAH